MGTRRKSYMVILSVIQFLSMLGIFLYSGRNVWHVVLLLFFANLSGAAMDVIIDALVVI